MNEHYTDLIQNAIDPQRAYETLTDITSFHRIQATPMFHEAAEAVVCRFREHGISASILSFPADGKPTCTSRRTIRAWQVQEAWCEIAGRRLSAYPEKPMSIMPRSTACDYREQPLRLYLIEKDTEPQEGLDLTGCLVFAHDLEQSECAWAMKCGAAGVITDYVTNRKRHYDSLRSTAFWWDETVPDKYFGFVITPREGDQLAADYRAAAARGETLPVRCYSDASFFDGELEVVEAFLPGLEPEGEILLTAHLCHPRTSANDNASGCSAVIEAMTALKELMAAGQLPAPRYGIRALLIPEFTGSYEYAELLVRGQAPGKPLAALNLDMVGGRASLGYGPIDLTLLPYSLPSFVGDLAWHILKDVSDRFEDFSTDEICYNIKATGFSGGSDHSVFSDPLVGVPCPMLGQWPDPYYHTSTDTIDKVSPSVLKASALVGATYAYTLAAFTGEDIPDLAAEIRQRFLADLEKLRSQVRHGKLAVSTYPHMASARLSYYLAVAESFRTFCPQGLAGSQASEDTAIASLQEELRALYAALSPEKGPAGATGAKEYKDAKLPFVAPEDPRVFRRTFLGPIDDSAFAAKCAGCTELFQSYLKNHRWRIPGFIQCEIQTQYYIDGHRTVAEIIDRVISDLGYGDVEGLTAYFGFLEAANLIVPA